MSSGKAKDTVV